MDDKDNIARITRRDFLKLGGGAALGTGIAVVTNSLLGESILGSSPELPSVEDSYSKYEIGWNARPWVWVNMAIAADKINGKIIAPGEEVSIIELMGFGEMDEVSRQNTDPTKGYVAAQMSNPRKLDGWGYGLCLASTAIFRATLDSPLEITERHTHYDIYPDYFKDMPMGTDAAVFDPDPGDTLPRVDLKLRNPTGNHVSLHLKIFDYNGTQIHSPKEEISEYIYKATYLDQVVKILQVKVNALTGMRAPQQYFPQYMFENKRIFVQSAVSGEAVDYEVRKTLVKEVRMTDENSAKQFTFTRRLQVDGKQFTEDYISEYK